ncbi:glycosyltransferase family 39 protein [Candidatus Daviesbacteria bacterium]|nr:glycosyltransferase family 39 protein [Candidatus Daviesbacteria bacterium]
MKKRYLILLVIIVLGIFLRFFKLQYFPVQLNHDEISQLYDAISIAQTGKDIYGNFLPTMFQSVNDFKSPFYTYATTLTYFILGDHEWIIRIPGAIFGVLIIIASYLFVLRLLRNYKIALLSSFLISTSPSEIFFSRKSFENGAGIFFMLIAFYFLLSFIEKQKIIRFLYLGITFMAVGMYTYFSHAMIIPLMLGVFILIFRKSLTGSKKKIIFVLLYWILLITPLFVVILTNPASRYRSQTVFITQDMNLVKRMEHTNKYKAILDFSFNRYLDQFNPAFIFGNGLAFTNQGPLDMGLLFFIQLPFLILGVIYLIKLENFHKERRFILAWILVGMLPSGLTFETHSPHRSIMVFTMLNIITAVGLYASFRKIMRTQIKFALIKKFSLLFLIALFITNNIYFIHLYYVNFPYEKSQEIHYPFKQVAQFARSKRDEVDQIIFDPLFGETAPVIGTATHYYLAYYGNFPPAKFQKEYRLGTREREVLFDKFSIRKIDWRKDKDLKNVLIIGSIWSLPIDSISKDKIIKTFYYYNKQPAFYVVKL